MKYYILGAGPSGLLFAILMRTRLFEEALRDVQSVTLVDHRARYTRDQIVNVSIHILNALFLDNDVLVNVLIKNSRHSRYNTRYRQDGIGGPSGWIFERSGAAFGEQEPKGTKGPKCGKPMGRIDWREEYATRKYKFHWDPAKKDNRWYTNEDGSYQYHPDDRYHSGGEIEANRVSNSISNYLLDRQFLFQNDYALGGIQLPIRRLEEILRSYIFDYLNDRVNGIYNFVQTKVTREFLVGIDKPDTTVVNCTGSPGKGNKVISDYFGVCKKGGSYTGDSGGNFRNVIYSYFLNEILKLTKDVYYLGPNRGSCFKKILGNLIKEFTANDGLILYRVLKNELRKQGINVYDYTYKYIIYDPNTGYVNLNPDVVNIDTLYIPAILGFLQIMVANKEFKNPTTMNNKLEKVTSNGNKRTRLQTPFNMNDISTNPDRRYGRRYTYKDPNPTLDKGRAFRFHKTFNQFDELFDSVIFMINRYTMEFDRFKGLRNTDDNYYGGLVIFIPTGALPIWDSYDQHTGWGLVTEQNLYRGFLDPGGCHYLAIQLSKSEYLALDKHRNDDNILKHLDEGLRHKVVQGFRYFLETGDRLDPGVIQQINKFLDSPRVLVSLFAYDTTFCLPPYSTVTPRGAQYFVTGDALMRAHFFTGRGIENATFLLTLVLDEINKKYEVEGDLETGLLYDTDVAQYIVEYMVREFHPVISGEYDLYNNSSWFANAEFIATQQQIYDAIDSNLNRVRINNPVTNNTFDSRAAVSEVNIKSQ